MSSNWSNQKGFHTSLIALLMAFLLAILVSSCEQQEYRYNYNYNGIQAEYDEHRWTVVEEVVEGEQNARTFVSVDEDVTVSLMRFKNFYGGEEELKQLVEEKAENYLGRRAEKSTFVHNSIQDDDFSEYNYSFQCDLDGVDMEVKITAKNFGDLLLIGVYTANHETDQSTKNAGKRLLDSAIFSTDETLLPKETIEDPFLEESDGFVNEPVEDDSGERLDYDAEITPISGYDYLGVAVYEDYFGTVRDAYLPLSSELETKPGMVSSYAHGIRIANSIMPLDTTAEQIVEESKKALLERIEEHGYTVLENREITIGNDGTTALSAITYQGTLPESIMMISYADIKTDGYLVAAISIDLNAVDQETYGLFQEIQDAYAFTLN